MDSKTEKFEELGTQNSYTIEYEQKEVGKGAQGSVHKIYRVNQTRYVTWAIKLLRQDENQLNDIQRLQSLMDWIAFHKLNTKTLSCLPVTLLKSESGQIGIPMRYIKANDLDDGNPLIERGSLAPSPPLSAHLSFPRQLSAAHQLAFSVHRLHERGMIIGDLALDNIIINPKNWALYLIDIDGGGLRWRHQPQFYAPITNNSAKGDVAPPEFSLRNNTPYSQEMDLWSLAVLLHYILTKVFPIGPFKPRRTFGQPIQDIDQWPPPQHAKTALHFKTLTTLGGPLKNAFLRSFNHGRKQPKQRLPAAEWERLLSEAEQNMYLCNCLPDRPFVALADNGQVMTVCPYCKQKLLERLSSAQK